MDDNYIARFPCSLQFNIFCLFFSLWKSTFCTFRDSFESELVRLAETREHKNERVGINVDLQLCCWEACFELQRKKISIVCWKRRSRQRFLLRWVYPVEKHGSFSLLIWSFAALFMLSLPFLSISLCACVLLCIYLSVFRPFESREFSYLEHERNGFPENRQIWYLFTFFRWYSTLIFEKWPTFSRLKMWPRPFVFVLRIFDLLYLSIEKKEKMLYIMYRSVFCGTFFTYTIYIYVLWISFSFVYIQSPRLFE